MRGFADARAVRLLGHTFHPDPLHGWNDTTGRVGNDVAAAAVFQVRSANDSEATRSYAVEAQVGRRCMAARREIRL